MIQIRDTLSKSEYLPFLYVEEIQLRDFLRALGIKTTKKYSNALDFLKVTTKLKKREEGVTHIEGHIFPVVYEFARHTYNNEIQIEEDDLVLALLHDIVENNAGQTFSFSLINTKFGTRISKLISEITNPTPQASKELNDSEIERYIKHLLATNNSNVHLIKSIDLLHELSSALAFRHDQEKTKRDLERFLKFVPVFQKIGYATELIKQLSYQD